jgi:DNA-directed RNA polymerase specialized sigma24 family protein
MRRGDAFYALCRAHRSSILHQTYAFTGDPETAQRATRDAFAQAARHRRRLVRDPDADAWLRARAFRASDRSRNRGRRPWYVRAADIDDANRPLLLGLLDLPPTVRTLVILRYLVGLDIPAAAREVGVSDGQAVELLAGAWGPLRRRAPGITEEALPARITGLRHDLDDLPVNALSEADRRGSGPRRTHVAMAGLVTVAALVAAGALRAAGPDATPTATPDPGTSRQAPVASPPLVMQHPVDNVCRDASGRCGPARATLSASVPPKAPADGEFLSVADLPLPTHSRGRWVATIPTASARNPAATLCDRTSFSSTRRARTRSFVVAADNRVPVTYGLAETTGRLATRRAANHFVDVVHAVVSTCHRRQLSLVIVKTTRLTSRSTGADGYVWSMKAQLSRNRSQRYLTAVIRVRRTVAQVTFTPTDRYPLSTARFVRLVSRAAHRLTK